VSRRRSCSTFTLLIRSRPSTAQTANGDAMGLSPTVENKTVGGQYRHKPDTDHLMVCAFWVRRLADALLLFRCAAMKTANERSVSGDHQAQSHMLT
jgi:hypothetical protein